MAQMELPWWSVARICTSTARGPGSIPGWGRSLLVQGATRSRISIQLGCCRGKYIDKDKYFLKKNKKGHSIRDHYSKEKTKNGTAAISYYQ